VANASSALESVSNNPANRGKLPDSGLSGLALVSQYHEVPCDIEQLSHELAIGERESTASDLVRAAKLLGFKARSLIGCDLRRLNSVPIPAILQLKDGSFVVIGRRPGNGTFRIVNGATKAGGFENAEEFGQKWNGTIILVTRRYRLSDTPREFGISWFRPSIWRYRWPLASVLLASFFVQITNLITPIMFQVVIDKVLTHKGIATLVMVVVGLIGIGFFQVLLQYLRTYILSHTTSRIDVELGTKIFDHLMRLPLAYFETRATGQTVARVREVDNVRNFLTGQGLTSVLDLLFIFVFIFVLFYYSITLALIVVASIPLYLIVAFALRPLLREKTKERFYRGAMSNQFLVESIVGIQTVKALAIEPSLKKTWEERLASYVRTSFEAVMLANLGQNVIQYINKVTTAAILFFGAYAVINGEMSVGALVAFNMIMNQVTAPILRLSQLWQDFQQVKVSVDRLGDVLNSPVESRALALSNLPPARGSIQVRNIVFRYRPDEPEVLKRVSIDIPAGQVLGIVGRSGSGKSTFAKLVQRLYLPEKGQILIDGVDIAQVDPAWLRRQIGVVMQENLLFNRTIHENIAIANPGMPRVGVIAMARLAGADEFVSKLHRGYDTIIEEWGANLSGGQRQRLAIARALANNPKILIFDEATSALDYESERIIHDNMKQIVRGRTVIIIAHRLAAVSACDRIIVIEDGHIVEDGAPQQLRSMASGHYGRLWRLQQAGDGEQVA
jgi:ATP-binding cassette, subfamily B, bacterial HlyB/CyaB